MELDFTVKMCLKNPFYRTKLCNDPNCDKGWHCRYAHGPKQQECKEGRLCKERGTTCHLRHNHTGVYTKAQILRAATNRNKQDVLRAQKAWQQAENRDRNSQSIRKCVKTV